jgi:hypothetical protein
MKDDPVRDFLERNGYADYIVEGGVDYLLTSWESTVASVIEGDIPDYTSYLRSVDRRRILQETLALIPMYEQDWYLKRVYAADDQIKPHLILTQIPLCGPAVATEQGYTPERHWWYYRRPCVVDETWLEFI